jgi:hypothetical protein
VIGSFISLLPILFYEKFSVGVPTTVNDSDTVCALGAAPPTLGNTGITLNVKTAPVVAVSEHAKTVFGAVSQAVQRASQSDDATPQSASISTSKDH